MTSQRQITASGDVAGGNIDKSVTHAYSSSKTRITGLIEQLRDQIGRDDDAAEFVERLLCWTTPKATELTRDLPTKLSESGQQHLIRDAIEAKERFAKLLRKTAFNPALQEIYAHILSEVYSTFNHKVKPLISKADEPGIIDEQIYNLACGIASQVADAPADLGLDLTEVIGMLYYLTGNCYLEWKYDDYLSPGH